jgi:hypothetical protein
MSPPAEKARPAPVKIAARATVFSSSIRKAAVKSSVNCNESEFKDSGRFSVITATVSRISKFTVSKVIFLLVKLEFSGNLSNKKFTLNNPEIQPKTIFFSFRF